MELKNVSVRYGNKTVYKNFSCTFPERAITCVMGASGCGKTTLLNVIAQTVPYEGEVLKKSASVGYIFQTPRLIPSYTVEQNIDFILRNVYRNKEERQKIIQKVLDEVGLGDAKKLFPSQLSGGMEQRVSVARAFAYPSEILLLDEPFKGLDISLKKKMTALLLHLLEENKKTVVLVTHDTEEAVLLADRILVLQEGTIKGDFSLSLPQSQRTPNSYPDIRESLYNLL